MKFVLFVSLLAIMVVMGESSKTRRNGNGSSKIKEKTYSKSFSKSTPTNCPDLFHVFEPAILKLYNDGEPNDFSHLLSDDSFIYCQNGNTDSECMDKQGALAQFAAYSSLLSNYEIKFYEIKLGTNWIQSNVRFTLTTSALNGQCKHEINGAFHLYCDQNGEITEQVDFLNEEELNNALSNALNPNGCTSP